MKKSGFTKVAKAFFFFLMAGLFYLLFYVITILLQPSKFSLGTFNNIPTEAYIEPERAYYLSGEIECYPRVIVSPNNFAHYAVTERRIKSLGEVRREACRIDDNYIATIRFYIDAPAKLDYSLLFPGEFCEYILFANRVPVAFTKTFRSDNPVFPSPRVINLPHADDGKYEIVLYIITPVTSQSSTLETIVFGTTEYIDRVENFGMVTSIINITIILVTILFCTIQLIAMRRDKIVLSYVLLALATLIRCMMIDDVIIMQIFPSLPYQAGIVIKSASLPLTILALIYHEYCMYPSLFKKIPMHISCAVLVLPFVNSLTLRTIPVLEVLMYISCFVAYLFIVIVVIKAHINNYPYSVWFSTAVSVVIAAGLIDFSTRNLAVKGRYVNAFPILVFTLIEMLMLAKRYSSQYEIEQFYTDELNRTLEAMQDSENAFLNAQMKPHFLYNTLNTIADLCVTDSEKAKSLIASLKDYCYMILSIDNVDKTVPLSREMELVTAYTSIEKERFPSINFYTDFPIRMPKIEMPPLTLQPLIENAIKHGVRKSDRPGVITLRIRESFDSVTFYVSDNGVGMSKETIERLFEEPKENKSIGVYNIDKRLKNLYHTGLYVESTMNLGTCVSFTVPK